MGGWVGGGKEGVRVGGWVDKLIYGRMD